MFSIGDRVVYSSYDVEDWASRAGLVLNKHYTVRKTDGYRIKVDKIDGYPHLWVRSECFTHLPKKSTYKEPVVINLLSKIKDGSMNLVKLAKDLTLPADEKLLRKVGLKSECGDYTDTALQIIAQKVCEDNKEYLLKLAEEQEKEEKK